MNENYKGSIELISGLKQKNDVDFPLVEAHAVAVYENEEEIRLDEKLKQLEESSTISDELKTEIVNASKDAVFTDKQFTDLGGGITENAEDIIEIQGDIKTIQGTLENFKGDNEELRLTYKEEGSILYLHTGDEVNDDAESGNVITQTFITGGGGGAVSSYKLTLKVLDESTALSVLKGRSAIIHYNAELKDGEENIITSGANVSLYVYVNDILKQTIKAPVGEGSIDLTSFLNLGTNNIKVTATFSEVLEDSGDTITIRSTKRWSVEVIEMFMQSDFIDTTVKTGDVSFPYKAYGNLSKTIYFYLDGKQMIDPIVISGTSGPAVTIPMQSHGSHTFEVWCTGVVGKETIESEHLHFDIMFAEDGNDTPIIRAKTDLSIGQQYSTTVVYYTVYSPDSQKSSITLWVNDEVQSTLDVDRSEQTWNYKPMDFGTKTLKITCGEAPPKEIVLEIKEFPYEISQIESGLELDFLPSGRTNQDTDYNVFHNNVFDKDGNEVPLTWTLSDNFDWVNGGWQRDAEGNDFFCVKAGTTATFNYNLFGDPYTVIGANSSKGNGKEFKLIFKTTNVADVDATFLTCEAPATVGNPVGLEMKVHTGYIKSNIEELDVPYSEEDIIEFDFNINPATLSNGEIVTSAEAIPMVMSYEDGTPFRPMTYTSTATSFTQANPVPITVGSPDCDVHIYRMKAYGVALKDEDILNNYIADGKNAEEMVDRFTRNQVFNDSGVLTPESLADARPDLKVVMIECPYFTNDKDNFVGGTSVRMIHRNGDPVLDNWTFSNGYHSGQGTSSNKYGDSGRNIDLIMCFDGEYKHKKVLKLFEGKEDEYWAIRSKLTLGDGSVIEDGTGKVGLTRTSVPTSYFNIKVNIASSENANNALIAKRFNRYLPYSSVGQKRDPFVKNTMEFVNCVVFLKETDTDLSTHREFQDNEWHFYAIGNIGDSKKTDQTRAYDPDDTKEFVVEILDNNLANAAFQTGYYLDEAKSLIKYPIDESLWVEGNEAYDALMADDWGGDYTFEMRYEHPDAEDSQSAANIQIWNNFYKWVITSSDDTFYNHLKDWVNVPAALYYYLFTERYTMMDNRAKNSFWHWAKMYITQAEVDAANAALKLAQDNFKALREEATEEEIAEAQAKLDAAQAAATKVTWFTVDDAAAAINEGYRFDWWDYDNDTSLGIDNSGKLRMPYGKEDIDKDEEGTFYFNAAESVPYRRIRGLFSNELRTLYNNLEDTQCWSSAHLIDEFDTWQGEFPEIIWLTDAERKYYRTYRNGVPDHLNLRMQGRKKYHRRQWDRDQEAYMASKYRTNTAQTLQILMRCKTPTDAAVKPNYTLNLIPYSDMYLNVQFGPSYIESVRAKAGQPYSITSPFADMTDNQVAIYNGQKIQSVGDVSTFYPSEGTFGTAEKLKTLIIGNGTAGYSNTYLTKLTTSSNNKLLEYLDIQNLAELKTVYLGIQNLKHFYAQGSGITEASFANNGLLEEAYLPAAINSVVANNLYYLHTLSFEGYDSLNKLVISNCPNIKELDIVKNAVNLSIVRLTNVNWTGENIASTEILNRLLACSGVQEDSITGLDQSVLTGRVKVPSIRQSEIDSYKAAWDATVIKAGDEIPEGEISLLIEYDTLITQYRLNFYNADTNKTLLYSFLIDASTLLSSNYDPVIQGWIPTPSIPDSSDGQHTYQYTGWSPALSGYVTSDSAKEFTAQYTPIIKTYKVTWMSDRTAPAEELYSHTVSWGEEATYVGETPTKVTTDNKFHLFVGWNKSTSFITKDTVVYPVWQSSDPTVLGGVDPITYTPTDIYGLLQKRNEGNSTGEGSGDAFFAEHIADGDQIRFQLGYMPTYEDDLDNEEVLIAETHTFDGTNATLIDTGIALFDEDKSFTLAIDFEVGYSSSTRNTLVSCYQYNQNGFELYSTSNGAAKVSYKADSTNNTKTVGFATPDVSVGARDICVIRKVKGDHNLYVYTNDRYSTKDIVEEVIASTAFSGISNTLYFGASRTIAQNGSAQISNRATGKIHYAKIWHKDLGVAECKKICSWIYEERLFDAVGAGRYRYSVDGTNSAMSFMDTQLLDRERVFNSATSADPIHLLGYCGSELETWLNNKVLAGVDPLWKQILGNVYVNALSGREGSSYQGSAKTSNNYLYIPAAGDVSSDYATQQYYADEINPAIIPYSNIATASDRIRKMSDSSNQAKAYFTRSASTSVNNYQYGVTQAGEVTTKDTVNNTDVIFRRYGSKLGICLCFSI